jgi:hypothetical protein
VTWFMDQTFCEKNPAYRQFPDRFSSLLSAITLPSMIRHRD